MWAPHCCFGTSFFQLNKHGTASLKHSAYGAWVQQKIEPQSVTGKSDSDPHVESHPALGTLEPFRAVEPGLFHQLTPSKSILSAESR